MLFLCFTLSEIAVNFFNTHIDPCNYVNVDNKIFIVSQPDFGCSTQNIEFQNIFIFICAKTLSIDGHFCNQVNLLIERDLQFNSKTLLVWANAANMNEVSKLSSTY